jgi:hypothetical protein
LPFRIPTDAVRQARRDDNAASELKWRDRLGK